MFKNLIQVYSLIVCYMASVVMMVALGAMLVSGTDLTLTKYKHMSQLTNYSSNEKYITYKQTTFDDKEKKNGKC